jgi:hypothetical protein
MLAGDTGWEDSWVLGSLVVQCHCGTISKGAVEAGRRVIDWWSFVGSGTDNAAVLVPSFFFFLKSYDARARVCVG